MTLLYDNPHVPARKASKFSLLRRRSTEVFQSAANVERNTNVFDICIVGLGYVGLPLAALLADRSLRVAGCDIRDAVVDAVNQGRITIVEPYLEDIVARVCRAGALKAFAAPQTAKTFIIAVPTPTDENHKSDLRAVMSAARAIAPVLRPGNLVILESTSPVGTTESVARLLADLRPDLTFPHQHPEQSDIMLAYCPERVLPGAAIRELTENSRTLGGIDKRSGEMARDIYATFVSGKLVVTSARAAELSKLAENSFRDVNIAFANELSMLCDRIGVDVWEVIKTANLHPRVNILSPGAGVGGHCIPVDPWFIHEMAPDITPLIRTAREVNDAKPHFVVQQIVNAVAGNTDAKIALLGLAYKPNVDDMRESPSIEIVAELLRLGYNNLHTVEPHSDILPTALHGQVISHHTKPDAAIEGAQAIAILVPHRAFEKIRLFSLSSAVVIDPVGYLR